METMRPGGALRRGRRYGVVQFLAPPADDETIRTVDDGDKYAVPLREGVDGRTGRARQCPPGPHPAGSRRPSVLRGAPLARGSDRLKDARTAPGG